MRNSDDSTNLTGQQYCWDPRELRVLRHLCETKGLAFMRYFFKLNEGTNMLINWHHYEIDRALQRVLDGEITRLIINVPPGYSKCVTEGTLITTPTGAKPVETLRSGSGVCCHTHGGKLINRRVANTEQHMKQCVEVITGGGRTLRVSYDHPVLTQRGWVRAEDLTEEHYLTRLCTEIDHATPRLNPISDAELDFITLMLFEGGTSCRSLRFTTADGDILDVFSLACANLGIEFKNYESHAPIDYSIMGGQKSVAVELLKKHGLMGKKAIHKSLPPIVFELPLRQKYRFLSLMFATDGFVAMHARSLGVTLGSKKLAEDISLLLDTCSIPSAQYFAENDHAGAFSTIISGIHAKRLLGKVDLLQKQPSFEKICETDFLGSFTFGYPYDVTKGLHYKFKQIRPKINVKSSKRPVTDYLFKRMKEEIYPSLSRWEMRDFIYDKVKTVTPIGEHKVYHLSIVAPSYDEQNFIANGLVVHNTQQAVITFIARGLALNSRAKFIHASSGADLAQENSSKIRDIVTAPEYQDMWPMKIRIDTKGKKRWFTEAGGGMMAAPAGGQITGFRAGRMEPGFTGAMVCFPYDETVQTEHGPIKIGLLVRNKVKTRVWSRNLTTNTDSLQPIDAHITNPGDHILKITQGTTTFRCTPDHKVHTRTRGYVPAKDLLRSDVLSTRSLDHVDADVKLGGNVSSTSAHIKNKLKLCFSKSAAAPGLVIPDTFSKVFPVFTLFYACDVSSADVMLSGNRGDSVCTAGDVPDGVRGQAGLALPGAMRATHPLDSVNADSKLFSDVSSAFASVKEKFKFGVSKRAVAPGFVVPDTFSKVFPVLPFLDADNVGGVDAMPPGDRGDSVSATGDVPDGIRQETCARSVKSHGKSAMFDCVLHVVGFGSVSKILKHVIRRVAIKMSDFNSFLLLTKEGPTHSPVDVQHSDLASNRETSGSIPFGAGPLFKETPSNRVNLFDTPLFFSSYYSVLASYISEVRDRVLPVHTGDEAPLLVSYDCHVDETFCLNVRANHNLYVSEVNSDRAVLCKNCDDLVKPDDAYSPVKRGKINDRFNSTMRSRLATEDVPMVIIMQRIHTYDISGFLLSGGSGDIWDHLVLPALIDENTLSRPYPEEYTHGRPIDVNLPSRVGSLWEEKHTVEELRILQNGDIYTFNAQMQQEPTLSTGGMFKDHWWRHYEMLPSDIDMLRIYCDTAQKTAEHNDHSVFQLWARSKTQGIFLVDQVRGKWEAPELETTLVEFWTKHKKGVKGVRPSCIKVEDKSSGSSLIQSIKRKYLIPVEPIPRHKDKVLRAMGVANYFSSGYIHLPPSAHTAWMHDYKEEFRHFSPLMTHAHDDQIDPTMDAVEDMLINNNKRVHVG